MQETALEGLPSRAGGCASVCRKLRTVCRRPKERLRATKSGRSRRLRRPEPDESLRLRLGVVALDREPAGAPAEAEHSSGVGRQLLEGGA